MTKPLIHRDFFIWVEEPPAAAIRRRLSQEAVEIVFNTVTAAIVLLLRIQRVEPDRGMFCIECLIFIAGEPGEHRAVFHVMAVDDRIRPERLDRTPFVDERYAALGFLFVKTVGQVEIAVRGVHDGIVDGVPSILIHPAISAFSSCSSLYCASMTGDGEGEGAGLAIGMGKGVTVIVGMGLSSAIAANSLSAVSSLALCVYSSISIAASQEISGELAKKGMDMLDAPVSGGEPKAI